MTDIAAGPWSRPGGFILEAAMASNGGAGKRAGGGTAKRRAARPYLGWKNPGAKKQRVQYHLCKQTVAWLGVHCKMVERNESSLVEEILLKWLKDKGEGRVLFEDALETAEQNSDEHPAVLEDRQDEAAA
jgi:hypothetical protein